jgi:hypothetical protein
MANALLALALSARRHTGVGLMLATARADIITVLPVKIAEKVRDCGCCRMTSIFDELPAYAPLKGPRFTVTVVPFNVVKLYELAVAVACEVRSAELFTT